MVNFYVQKPKVMSEINLGPSFRNSAFMQIRAKPTKILYRKKIRLAKPGG